jgi:Uma2 family endonuclease
MATAAGHLNGDQFTYADLRAMPDDSLRREIIDGQLLVTPSPITRHQQASVRIVNALLNAAPREFDVIPAPWDWIISDTTVVEPDVLVVDAEDTVGDFLTRVPLLVVEVLSRSTRTTDLHNKKALYEREGVPSYWVVDPKGEGDSPVVTVFELVDGAFVLGGHHDGETPFRLERPFPVEIVPARLTGPRG